MSLHMVGLILTAVLIPVAVTEFSDWCPWLAKRLVRWSARRLGDPQASARYEEEWLANLGMVPGKVSSLVSALGYLAAVPNMRRTLRRGPQGIITKPMQLPTPRAPLTIRTKELAVLDGLLAHQRKEHSSSTTLIAAISGMPGTGKTNLALNWAHKVKRYFPDGSLYADLRSYSHHRPLDPFEVLTDFLQALGVQAVHIPDRINERVSLYHSLVTRRRMLIVLDNATTFNQVKPFLPDSPRSVVLITSRRQLSMPSNTHAIALDTLSVDAAVTLLKEIAGGEKVDAEPQAAIELVMCCACLPLAIHPVAARLRDRSDWTITQLVEELRGPQPPLRPGRGEQNLRSIFDLAYRALPADAQHLLRHLGALSNPYFSHYQATLLANTTPDKTKGLLNILTKAHLIGTSPQNDLYWIHELLLTYARELPPQKDQSRRAVRGDI